MTNKRKTAWAAVAIVVVCLAVSLTGQAAGVFDFIRGGSSADTVTITRAEYERLQQFQKLAEIMDYIQAYYYVEPDTQSMIENATRGMLYGLEDPYTFYYTVSEWTESQADDAGNYSGIGLQLLGNYQDYTVTVTRVFKSTPSEAVGIQKGDILVKVDDLDVDAYTMQSAVNQMRGTEAEVGVTVHIEVVRDGELLSFEVPRAIIHVNRVESMMLPDNVGYIMLYEFAGDCAEAFEAALKDLRSQGATSLVVDLRDNPGGWVQDSVSIADLFLDRELLVYSVERDGTRENSYTKNGKDDIPLVILINENSASSSEILAGGLQDLQRATIVGTTSYGKGIIQYVIPMASGDAFQFTVAQYYTPSGNQVHHVGIAPDILVEIPEEQQGTLFKTGDLSDPQLAAAWEAAKDKVK